VFSLHEGVPRAVIRGGVWVLDAEGNKIGHRSRGLDAVACFRLH